MKIAYILNYLISANLFYISKYLIQFFFPLIKQLFQSFTYKKIILYNDTNKHRDKSCFNPSTLLFTFPIILYDCKRKRILLHTVHISCYRETQRECRRSRSNFAQSLVTIDIGLSYSIEEFSKKRISKQLFIPHPYLIPCFTLPKLLSRSRQETFAP